MGAHRGRRRGPRTLTPEEHALWERIAATTDRRIDQVQPSSAPDATPSIDDRDSPASSDIPGNASPADTRDAAASVAPQPRQSARPIPRLNGSTARIALAGEEVGPVGRPEAGLDRRTATRLRKGAREPDARIDLHGMSAERAHRACLTFLADAQARGARVVLVITGKGRPRDDDFMARGRGVLRESLPGWLRASPLGASIVGIYRAHQRHGGDGAFYVYLKRRR